MMTQNQYQLATTTDLSLPLRKWWHRGTQWAVSALSAAYACKLGTGDVVRIHARYGALVYEFADGTYLRVATMGAL